MPENIVENWVGWIVGAGISIAIGYWILSSFLPLDEFFSWVGSLLGKKKVVVRCRECSHDNDREAKHCSNCGEEL